MVVIVTCKNEEDPIKNEGTRVLTTFSNYMSMGIFSVAQGQLTPQSVVESDRISKLVRDFEVVLLTYKYEEDPIKNEGARVLARFPYCYPM